MISQAKAFDEERFKQSIALLIAIVTVIGAVTAMLQGDAGARDDRANRDTKRYATEAMGRKVSGDARVNYDFNSAYQTWYELDTLAQAASNRGDESAAARYIALRDRTVELSPLLAPPYFDAETGAIDVARYEADTYVVEIAALNENFLAASIVKDAWDTKSNAYVLHLTLLAVALFLYGLSITIAGQLSRWIFAAVGSAVTLVVLIMIGSTWAQPVVDLRDSDAISAFASGAGLEHQGRWTEAVAAYDQALIAAPNYTNALVSRARAHAQLDDHTRAIADYERARAEGEQSASVAGELAWLYYLEGRLGDAAAMNRAALATNPDELWIQFDLALSLLASGQIDASKAEYQVGMDRAAKQVADAQAAGQEAPSFLWWSLDDAALSIDALLAEVSSEDATALKSAVANPGAIEPVAAELSAKIRSLAVGLEYTGKPPSGSVSAVIQPFAFGVAEMDAEGVAGDPVIGDTFPFGVDEVQVLFDYTGMQDGSDVLFKVLIDGEEDPSWRVAAPWDLGASGSAVKVLSLAYSDTFVLTPGEYTVAMYVDSHLVQQGSFTITEADAE